ncbi:YwpF family protein [Alkalihalobacillus trypoxylicola]|uniref:YwpF-like protein n=1 Tax=Alkalihalobacillus trypoxylicola TaxID=519424 RepID=A0A161PEB3_9BACI|nr:YwpF family protein [Alkalihalobacillus trypoxylicola]KYG26630.1 hypothetical protein AZF04_12545 [Alkalihalobacillus trypoxylicola]
MKTFKLYSISLLKGINGKVQQFPLTIEQGLIINMENSRRTWLIEAVVDKEHLTFFKEVHAEDKDLLINVVITSKDNYPATMVTKVSEITKMSKGLSILMKGKLVLGKDEVLDDVVNDLVGQDYHGNHFIEEFKQRKSNLAAYSQKTLDEVYQKLSRDDEYRLV